jgi:hypothetical protein
LLVIETNFEVKSPEYRTQAVKPTVSLLVSHVTSVSIKDKFGPSLPVVIILNVGIACHIEYVNCRSHRVYEE